MCLESVSIRVFLVCLRNWSSKKFKKIHSIKTMLCNMNEYINYNIYQWKMRRLWKVNLSSLMCTSIILILLSCNGKGEHIIPSLIMSVFYDFIITINLRDIKPYFNVFFTFLIHTFWIAHFENPIIFIFQLSIYPRITVENINNIAWF